MSEVEIRLRRALPDDCERVLAWANDPVTRAASFRSETIPPDVHRRWYDDSLRGARTLYIAESNAIAIGLARLDTIDGETAEVGLTLAADHRGRGHAARVLDALCKQAAAAGLRKLVARIRDDNIKSRVVFERAGFARRSTETVDGIGATRYELVVAEPSR
ncbi:MAG TPA: GNAT family N-acetyltransferase [Gammaproteobacteria bacterium]